MSSPIIHRPDPRLDLVLERIVDVPRELVWKAWTVPEHVMKWFTPEPWKTVACEIDLRPGGMFRTVMRSPQGEEFPNVGCYLEIIENQKLACTDALEPGYRPAKLQAPAHGGCPVFAFSAIVLLEPHGKGTKYTAIALHRDEEGRNNHEAMGFHEGWGKALDQLVAVARKL